MSDDELDLVETEDLVQALRRRHCCTLIVLHDKNKPEDEDWHPMTWWSGGMSHILGLIEYAKLPLMDRVSKLRTEQLGEGDE